MKIAAITTMTALACAAVSGCSAEAHVEKKPTPTLSKKQLEDESLKQVEKGAGTKVDGLDCNGPLEGKIGATQRCVIHKNGFTLGMTATTKSVEGHLINFEVQGDPTPTPAP